MASIRLIIRMTLFGLLLIAGVITGMVYTVISGKFWFNSAPGQKTIMFWMQVVAYILGLRIRTSGKFATTPALLVSNHISWLDVFVIGSRCPVAFLSKSDVAKWPLLGYLAIISGTLFVDRNSKKAVCDAKTKINASIQAGRSVVIFPEGTTTNGDNIKPFQSSFYQSAVESDAIVQTLVIQYPWQENCRSHAPYIGDDVFFEHLVKVMKAPSTEAQLICCPPLNYHKKYSRKELAEITHRQVRTIINLCSAVSS